MAGLIALLVVLVIALYVCWLMIQPFVNVLMWAAVLSVVFYPMHRRILDRTSKPSLAAILSTLLVVLLILLPVTFITVAVVRELSGAAASFQASDGSWQFTPPPRLGWLVDRLRRGMGIDSPAARGLSRRWARRVHEHRSRRRDEVPRRAAADLGLGARRQHADRRRRRR